MIHTEGSLSYKQFLPTPGPRRIKSPVAFALDVGADLRLGNALSDRDVPDGEKTSEAVARPPPGIVCKGEDTKASALILVRLSPLL